jgi:NAD(P)-dependent dehydrogenase (short-subunit alcohol dehydrogenase family)
MGVIRMLSVATPRDAAIFTLGGVIFGFLTYIISGSVQPSWSRNEKLQSSPTAIFDGNSTKGCDTKEDDNSNDSKNQGLLVITGASRGIGLAVAELFVKKGWQVLNLSRGKCPNNAVVTRQIDLSHSDVEQSLTKYIYEFIPEPRRICLVHNAATIFQDSALSVDIKAMRNAFQLNVFTPAILNKLISPLMSDGSSILYIGSTLSEKGIPGRATYVSSKHAIAGLMKVTCQDLKGRQIHTACICPGFTATEMLVQHLHSSPSAYASILSMQTMSRLIEPYEIANFLYFCASNPSVNGGVLHCNLGQVER